MAFAARHVNQLVPAKRTFAEMIAAIQANQAAKAKFKTETQLKAVPVSSPPPAQVRKLPDLKAPERDVPDLPAQLEIPNSVRLKAADFQRRQHLLVSHVNRTLPNGCYVLAWSILPKELFQGDLGRFLMLAYDFYACAPENTLLLPGTAEGVQFLSLPRHPLVTALAHIDDASKRIGQLRQTVTADHQRALLALQKGDPSHLYKSSERRALYGKQLTEITYDIAETAFGDNIWSAHETRFRRLIQSL
jgi:hypothetical protein